MHTNWCVLIEISMEIGMLNFWSVIICLCNVAWNSLYLIYIPSYLVTVVYNCFWSTSNLVYNNLFDNSFLTFSVYRYAVLLKNSLTGINNATTEKYRKYKMQNIRHQNLLLTPLPSEKVDWKNTRCGLHVRARVPWI